MKKVLIIQAVCKQYRVPFFEQLHSILKQEGFELKVAYGYPHGQDIAKGDNVDLNSDLGVKVNNLWFFDNKMLYQSVIAEISPADLIIVEQANKHIINYFLIFLSFFKIKKVAFWGHGKNRQSKGYKLSEVFKQKILNSVNWWFAYTQGTADYIISHGVSSNKVTVVQNSIDTESLREDLSRIDDSNIADIKLLLGIDKQTRIGLFCGSLYPDKCVNFLIHSAKLIKQEVPDFELLIIGGGPDAGIAKAASTDISWIHYLGTKFGMEKARYLKIADVFLMPGLVGLAILDAFTAGLPVFTTDIPIHSPEIEYLKNGMNGFITDHNYDDYAYKVAKVLNDLDSLTFLKEGALASANIYTINTMVQNFKSGIVECLTK